MLGEELDARLAYASVPVLPGAVELAEQGILPGGSQRNEQVGRDAVSTTGLSEAERILLFDAQTSGGLLIAVEPEKVNALLDRLHSTGVVAASRIGTVEEGTGKIEVTD
jgi:selenide,water dikinase